MAESNIHRVYVNNCDDYFVLTFHEREATYFSIIKFLAKDQSGNTIDCYVEESGVVLNDVVDGVSMLGLRSKQVDKADYLKFVNSAKKGEKVSERDLIEKIILSVHGIYIDPF
jgi:hypothetical protein